METLWREHVTQLCSVGKITVGKFDTVGINLMSAKACDHAFYKIIARTKNAIEISEFTVLITDDYGQLVPTMSVKSIAPTDELVEYIIKRITPGIYDIRARALLEDVDLTIIKTIIPRDL